MTPALRFFDSVLSVALLGVAWMALASRDLFRAVVLFIVFGLLLSLAWVRLRAPDIALAEAAIGAGLTGVLLLNTLRSINRKDRNSKENIRGLKKGKTTAMSADGATRLQTSLLAILTSVAGWYLALVAVKASGGGGGLGPQVRASLAESGVASQVTAVLLNFRGYDTLLEIGVLMLAVFGVRSLHGGTRAASPSVPYPDSLLTALVRMLVPMAVLVAGYLLWSGTHAPGGAFQAGAVLAAGGVLLRLAGITSPRRLRGGLLLVLLAGGFVIFLLIAGGVMVEGNNLLEYPRQRAGSLIVMIESALTVSIAFILAELVSRSFPPARSDEHFTRSTP